jgi:hypothetical protein
MNEESVIVMSEEEYARLAKRGRPQHRGDYFSLRHPQMSTARRAKIFAPFAALKGFEEEVRSKEVLYVKKRDLDADEFYDLNEKLNLLHEKTKTRRLARQNRVVAEIEYYVPCMDDHCEAYKVRGRYVTITGMVEEVDPHRQILRVQGQEISFNDIYRIRII